jgi:hypothetical protein
MPCSSLKWMVNPVPPPRSLAGSTRKTPRAADARELLSGLEGSEMLPDLATLREVEMKTALNAL